MNVKSRQSKECRPQKALFLLRMHRKGTINGGMRAIFLTFFLPCFMWILPFFKKTRAGGLKKFAGGRRLNKKGRLFAWRFFTFQRIFSHFFPFFRFFAIFPCIYCRHVYIKCKMAFFPCIYYRFYVLVRVNLLNYVKCFSFLSELNCL